MSCLCDPSYKEYAEKVFNNTDGEARYCHVGICPNPCHLLYQSEAEKLTFKEALDQYKRMYPDEERREAVKAVHDLIHQKAVHLVGEEKDTT